MLIQLCLIVKITMFLKTVKKSFRQVQELAILLKCDIFSKFKKHFLFPGLAAMTRQFISGDVQNVACITVSIICISPTAAG